MTQTKNAWWDVPLYEDQKYRLYPFEDIDDNLFHKLLSKYKKVWKEFNSDNNTFYIVEDKSVNKFYIVSSFYIGFTDFELKLHSGINCASYDGLLLEM